ncbi:MAG: OsmC family protein [bacterium]
MDYSEKIRSAWIRSTKGLARRPELGKTTRSVTARMTDGLTCEVESEEGWKFTADMPEVAGGNEAGAVPSTFAEAAFASCLVIGYRMLFAAREVPVNTIQVECTGVFDARGLYAVGDISPGFDGPVTYTVHVDSPADEETVVELLNQAEAHSPLIDIFKNPVELHRELHITHTAR